jgi:hypothetical protein
VIFAGTVVELTRDSMLPDSQGMVRMNGFLGTHAIFAVSEPFVGIEGQSNQIEVRTGMGGGDCGYPFVVGQKYVVYAGKTKDGILATGICSRTAPEDHAQADLAYLRGLPNAGRLGYVVGVASDGQGERRMDETLGTWLVAVGTAVARCPPHRPVLARLTHTVPTLDV